MKHHLWYEMHFILKPTVIILDKVSNYLLKYKHKWLAFLHWSSNEIKISLNTD